MSPRIRILGTALLLALPRIAASYVGYAASPLLLIKWRWSRRQVVFFALIVAYSLAALGIAALGRDVSPTAFLIEWALVLPIILFIVGIPVVGSASDLLLLLRSLNLAMVVISIVKMPWAGIPYVTGLPDLWNGPFGSGGAKILTILGFFGILQELLLHERGRKMSWICLVAAVANFVVPNYIIGLAVGLAVLAVAFARRMWFVLIIVAVAVAASWETVMGRINAFNTYAADTTGIYPKLYAYKSAWDAVLAWQPFGAGVGQLASTPQTWLDPAIFGSHDVPRLPGLSMSDSYREFMASYTEIGIERASAFKSSLNQPLTGVSAMLGEWGAGGAVLLAIGAWRAFTAGRGPTVIAAGLFFVLMNVVDSWFDSTWFGVALLAFFGVVAALKVEGDPMATNGRIDNSREPSE